MTFLYWHIHLIDKEWRDERVIRNHLSTVFWVTRAFEYVLLLSFFQIRSFELLETIQSIQTSGRQKRRKRQSSSQSLNDDFI